MFFLVFVLFLDCFFNMHLCAKLQPYRSKVIFLIDYKNTESRGLRDFIILHPLCSVFTQVISNL